MQAPDWNHFLDLLTARIKSFSKLKSIQAGLAENISSAKQGQMAKLNQEVMAVFNELDDQKKQLAPYLNLWRELSQAKKTSLLGGGVGTLIDEIEKNALEITAVNSGHSDLGYSKGGGNPEETSRILDRINLSR